MLAMSEVATAYLSTLSKPLCRKLNIEQIVCENNLV